MRTFLGDHICSKTTKSTKLGHFCDPSWEEFHPLGIRAQGTYDRVHTNGARSRTSLGVYWDMSGMAISGMFFSQNSTSKFLLARLQYRYIRGVDQGLMQHGHVFECG